MKKLCFLILTIIVNYAFGQWSGTGSTISTPATEIIVNNTKQTNATLWFGLTNSGPTSPGNYYIKAYDYWGPTIHFQATGDGGNERMNVTVDGKIGIGTTTPSAKLHIYDDELLGSNVNDSKLLSRIAGRTYNTFMNNIWLRRDASGPNWFTARLHDGISVDASYLSPGTNTRTWWERDPYNNIQEWGNSNQVYMTLKSGNLGIGTSSPDSKLSVNGTIHTKEVKVDLTGWPDHVFHQDYPLMDLEEVHNYIIENNHLPNIPTESEVKENGINLGEMNAKLLEKIEELTLYLIEMKKENESLKERVTKLENPQK